VFITTQAIPFEQLQIHEPVFARHALGDKTEGATQVAGIGRLYDERSEVFGLHQSITLSMI
jgi:hypothetical protein